MADNYDSVAAYREGVKNLMRMVLLQAFVIAGLMALTVYVVMNVKPQDRYFAETGAGLKMQITGLDDPNMNTAAILSWAATTATDVMTFGFNDIMDRFAKTSKNFTKEGWISFRDAMVQSKTIEGVRAQQQIITSILSEPPVLIQEGMVGGDYGWIVQMPMIMTIRAGGERQVRKLGVKMFIVRMPTAANPMGIGIKTWLMS